MTPSQRLYGTLFGVDHDDTIDLQPYLSPCSLEQAADGSLEFVFEGIFPDDIEDFLDVLRSRLPDHARGHLDLIDNDAWCLFRYSFTRHSISRETMNLDDYLDRYKHFG